MSIGFTDDVVIFRFFSYNLDSSNEHFPSHFVGEYMTSWNISKRLFARNYSMRLLLGTLVSLVIADGIISRFLVSHGFAREGNPFLQSWINGDKFLLLKVLFSLLAALILWDMFKHNPRLTYISTTVFVVLYTFIVFWSLHVYFVV